MVLIGGNTFVLAVSISRPVFPEFPFSHSRFYSTSVNTELAATTAQFETQWTLALHAMTIYAKSFETSLSRQTKLFLSCVGLPQSFVFFVVWMAINVLFTLISHLWSRAPSLFLTVLRSCFLISYVLICAGIIFYPSLNILYLPSARRSTNHISYAGKRAYIRKPTGRGRYTERER